MRRESKILSVIYSILITFFCISAAFAVPILCRGWYYSQAETLELSQVTGFSTEVIHGAYDEVMDYLVLGKEFGTGELVWSESGRAHFADCRGLFQLVFVILTVSAAGLVLVLISRILGLLPYHFGGFTPAFWSLTGTLLVLIFFGVWALVDFNKLFTAFHTLCFPGKTNWIFDYRTDQIILILPEAFWARTAALVGMIALGLEVLSALMGHLIYKVCRPRSVYEIAQRL